MQPVSPGESLSGGGADGGLEEGVDEGVVVGESRGPPANPNPETANAAATTAAPARSLTACRACEPISISVSSWSPTFHPASTSVRASMR